KGVGKAAGGLMALAAATAVIKQIQQATEESLPGLENLTGQLIGLGEASAESSWMGLSSEFDSLGDSIGRLADSNMFEKVGDGILKVMSFGQLEGNRLNEARNEIAQLDAALANLASTGNAELAATALERLGETQGLNAEQMRNLT